MILFVGDKPGRKNKSQDVAFVGTKSYKTLLEWIYKMNIDINDAEMVNSTMLGRESSNCVTKELQSSDGRFWYPEDMKIVALGNSASKVLESLEIDHFKLPHPSGLNRKLNNKRWLNKELKKCSEWINV